MNDDNNSSVFKECIDFIQQRKRDISENTAQMIIISHERALDSFVTDIYTFKKSNHITKVERESM